MLWKLKTIWFWKKKRNRFIVASLSTNLSINQSIQPYLIFGELYGFIFVNALLKSMRLPLIDKMINSLISADVIKILKYWIVNDRISSKINFKNIYHKKIKYTH